MVIDDCLMEQYGRQVQREEKEKVMMTIMVKEMMEMMKMRMMVTR